MGLKSPGPLYHCRTAFDYCNADQLYSCDHRCCVIFCPGQVACGDCSTGDTWYCKHDSGSFRADVVCTGIVSALDHPQMKARESLKISRQIMKGNKGRLFYIYLSFIGLQILCLLSLGIGSLWVYPYQSQTLVIFIWMWSGRSHQT